MFESLFAAISHTQCAHVAIPEASEQALRFYKSGNILWIITQAWALIIPLLFLVTGVSGKLGKFASKWGKNWFFTLVVYLVLFIAIFQLLDLPLDFYASYIRLHDYGLSNQSFGRWFGNYGKSSLVSLIGAIAFVWIFYLLLKKSPKRWWFYSSLAAIVILFITMLVQPIWIDPLFNKFGPMQNKELEQEILHLAAKARIENGRIYEVDKSQDTTMLNAYVVGLGSSNRIVLWDTTLAKLSQDQLLFVMGHEMGHYVLHHIWWGLAYYGALSFLIFYLTYRSANALLHRYRKKFGFSHLYEIASLPLLLLLTGFFLLLSTPLSNFFSRTIEHHADEFGLEITQNNQAAGEAFVALQQQNLANPKPGPIYKFWRSTHPPLGERIDFCNSYCPWKQNRPLKYGRFFQNE